MKNKLLTISAILVMSISGTGVALAGAFDESWQQMQHSAGQRGANYGEAVDPRLIVANIVKLGLSFTATILFALCVYAGYNWMTAQGNEEKIAKSKQTIVNSTIGLVIILASYGITIVITNLAVGRSLSTQTTTGGTLDQSVRSNICNSSNSWVNWMCR